MHVPAHPGKDAAMRYWRVPLDVQQIKIPRGEIHLIKDRCKGCEFCVEFCPRGVLRMSKDFNAKGYHYPEVMDPENCVECDLCEVICPDFAIFCLPAEEESSDKEVSHGAS
jgi:2-oxoglutarate ferredoxin oxidoreductase subunit delta